MNQTDNKDKSIFTWHEIDSYIFPMKSLAKNAITVVPYYVPEFVLAGGFFASYLQKSAVKDLDLFVLDSPKMKSDDMDYFQRFRDDYYITESSEYYKKGKQKGHIVGVWTHRKKFSFSYYDYDHTGHNINNAIQVQYIFTTYKTAEDLISEFDYCHCCIFFQNDKLTLTRKAFDSAITKKLVVNNPDELREARRSKFLKRGYTE